MHGPLGHVMLDGEDITGTQAHELVRAGVGYVPQNTQRVPQPDGAARTSRWAAS